MKKVIISIFFASILSGNATAQSDGVQELKKMLQTYRDAPELSFDVAYYYADEKTPSIYLDSLRGSCKVKGTNYWSLVDNTETISSGGMVVVLYKSDSIMYLAKPSSATQSANPFAVMDSFLSQKDQFTCRLVEEKSDKRIVVEFANAQPYKRLEYFINKKTGYINRMVMLVRSEEMYEQSARPQPTAEPSFSIVEMKFSNYRAKGLDEKDFDLGKYFKKEESGYVTLPPYNSYKIFIGTPNL